MRRGAEEEGRRGGEEERRRTFRVPGNALNQLPACQVDFWLEKLIFLVQPDKTHGAVCLPVARRPEEHRPAAASAAGAAERAVLWCPLNCVAWFDTFLVAAGEKVRVLFK